MIDLSIAADDFALIREGLAQLPRASNHTPGQQVDTTKMLVVRDHRAALDPNRALVVGNRGMGKSFWTHALADPTARELAARTVRELSSTEVHIGFNAGERVGPVAPTRAAINDALRSGCDPESIWRTVLLRIARTRSISTEAFPESFTQAAQWTAVNGEQTDRILTELDDQVASTGSKLLVVFDALDRLGDNWHTTRSLTQALLKRALAAHSYRAIRLKLFMRRDQFEDLKLFEFPDGSKIRSTRVDLSWSPDDLFELLFTHLKTVDDCKVAFDRLVVNVPANLSAERNRLLVNAIAGEFMGKGKKRGRVFTWLPLHLSDARGETSPRTFLTAWSEAAKHSPPPAARSVDHHGIIEGVRKASEDRYSELKEDYWWIEPALNPLRDQAVPMEQPNLKEIWKENNTADSILRESPSRGLAPVQLEDDFGMAPEQALLDALVAIGVFEQRSNGKVNIPDIFRVEAGIKRRGGVKPPSGNRTTRSSHT